MKKIILAVITLLFANITYAQHRQGSWQDYLSYARASKIALSPDKVYCATGGGIIFYDTRDNSINKLAKTVDLSDFEIQTIGWSEENKVLIVAYKNCNIDLIFEKKIVNLPDIKRKQITGKKINGISIIDNEAYLACSFGIVVLNLQKQEVKDTYIIGESGGYMSVNDVEADSEYLYAATDNGILRADRHNSNLLDFNSWKRIENIPRANGKFNHLAFHAGKIIANYTPEAWFEDEMYVLNGESWEPYRREIKFAADMQVNGNYLTIASRRQIFIVDENHNISSHITSYRFPDKEVSSIDPLSVALSADGTIWIADESQSFIRHSNDNYERITYSGPIDNTIFSLHQIGSALWVTPGNKTGWIAPRFSRFSNNRWSHFSKNEFPQMDEYHNIHRIAVDPKNENHFFAASWGGGLLEFENDELVHRYENHNSPLATALPGSPNAPYVRIGGMDFDSEGNLWLTNSEVAVNLLKFTPDKKWEGITLPEVANNYKIGDLLVTKNDDKWIIMQGGNDAYVVDKTGKQKKRLLVTSYFNNGVHEEFNRMNDILSIVEDLKGAIWIGTTKGVAVYSSPERIWESEKFYASQPGLDLNDGLYHRLLGTENVTAIAVDGANRKWLGTSNSGVYLVSENGEKEIQHFTTGNSPLISDNITSLAINEKTGEVFIGTYAGIVSYQGDAVAPNKVFSDVYVYPNPVRETWDGPVIITGLVESTDVKITDITGNLVYQTTSLGGQAVWNGKNLSGNRVKTGVYLVFCTDKFGEETHIEKLLFIH